jgi:hypothetical protein
MSEKIAEQWRDQYSNLLSCYELNGEFGLWASLQSYYASKGLPAAVIEAIQDGDERAFIEALFAAQSAAFIDLCIHRNALGRLQLVEELPGPAAAELTSMYQSVSAAPGAAPVSQEPVAAVVAETPVEICAREFKEMSSDRWKKKWLLDQRNRPIADLCAAEGRI